MTLRAALLTGLPLMRKNRAVQPRPDAGLGEHRWTLGWICPKYLLDAGKLTKEDLVATDWIVKKRSPK